MNSLTIVSRRLCLSSSALFPLRRNALLLLQPPQTYSQIQATAADHERKSNSWISKWKKRREMSSLRQEMNSLISKLKEKRKIPDSVAVLRLAGMIQDGGIGGGRRINLNGLHKQIEDCFRVKNLKAVCLQINSPGGSPVQSELVATRIKNLAAERKVKVYAFIEDVGASGGYFIACAADEIYASESSIVGSIGVLNFSFGFQEVIKRWGIERRLQTAGENKVLADPFSDQTEKSKAKTEATLRAIHKHFIDFVKRSRGDRLVGEEARLFSGEYWTGKEAAEIGLVDGLDDMHTFVKKNFGEKVKLVPSKPARRGLRALLNPESSFSSTLASMLVAEFFDQLEDRFVESSLISRFR